MKIQITRTISPQRTLIALLGIAIATPWQCQRLSAQIFPASPANASLEKAKIQDLLASLQEQPTKTSVHSLLRVNRKVLVPLLTARLESSLSTGDKMDGFLILVRALNIDGAKCANASLQCLRDENRSVSERVTALSAIASIAHYAGMHFVTRCCDALGKFEDVAFSSDQPLEVQMRYYRYRSEFEERVSKRIERSVSGYRKWLVKKRIVGFRTVVIRLMSQDKRLSIADKISLIEGAIEHSTQARPYHPFRARDDFDLATAEAILSLQNISMEDELGQSQSFIHIREWALQVLAVQHADPIIRELAIEKMDPSSPKAAAILEDTCGDSNTSLALAAMQRLASLGRRAGPWSDSIQRQLEHPDPARRKAAAKAFHRILGN